MKSFLSQGDTTIYAFEITDESPFICPLSHHRCSSLHQGLSFLTKNHCDVSSVEFAKSLRLTNNTIEPLSFTVPRIKVRMMQSFIFISLIKQFFRVNFSKMICSRLLKLHGNPP